MVKQFDFNFNGTNGTTLTAYNAAWVHNTTLANSSNAAQTILYNNSARRPTSQTNANQAVTILNVLFPGATPDNYECILDFSCVGVTTAAANIGVLIRITNGKGLLFRYRANAGYQAFTLANQATTLITTAAVDVNPTGVTNANPLRRRLRVSCVGNVIRLYVDSYNNGTGQWTVGTIPLITTTQTSYPTGQTAIWMSSPATDVTTPSDGFFINQFSLDDTPTIPDSNPPTINSSATATATVNQAFNYQITASSSSTITAYSASGLPTGLTLNTSTGVISGTPTVIGSSTVILTATNENGTSPNFTLTLTVNNVVPTINSASTASATTGQSFTYQTTATGSPTSYAISGTLPTGLSFSTSTGAITGTPSQTGTFNLTLTATNGTGTSPNFSLTLTVSAPAIPVINSPSTLSGTAYSAISPYTITATNSPTSFAASGLPTGLSLNTSTGVISGTPTTAGTTNATLTATNNFGTSANFTLAVTIATQPVPVINSSSTLNGTVNNAVSYTITATNSPTSFAASGLPTGLSLNTSTGIISGTSTVEVNTTATLTASNSGGVSQNFSLNIVISTVQVLPNAPTNLGLKSFSPLRTDSPLNLAYYTFTDAIEGLIHLQWTPPGITGTTPIIGYKIEQSLDNTNWTNLVLNTGSNQNYIINLNRPSGIVYYRVSAINSSGNSITSAVFTSTPVSSQVNGKMIQVNGVWTFFTHPRSVFYKGHIYTGWVNNAGIVGVTKTNTITKQSTSFNLEDVSTYVNQSGGAEIDDHDNAGIFICRDGRVACFYGAHNDPAGMRVRVSTYPEDISSFSTAIAFSPANTNSTPNVILPTCYSNPRYLEDSGQVIYHFRTGMPPNAPHALHYFDAADNPKNLSTYKAAIPLIQSTQSPWSNQRPYVQSAVNNSDRLDFFTTDGHPSDSGLNGNGNGSSLYHFYIKWDKVSKTFKYYKSDGTEITSGLPLRPKISGGGSDITQVWDGTTYRAWCWDIAIGFDGNPCVLFTTYDNGGNSFGYTNQRYRYSRWNGSIWTTSVDITGTNVAGQGTSTRGVSTSAPGMGTNNVNGFSGSEPAYTGGICFDSQNPNIVYLSNPVYQTTVTNPDLTVNDTAAIREIQQWETYNNGATWQKTRDITKNSPPNIINGRPYSPRNHDGNICVVWWRGAYAGWVRSFNTNLWGASAQYIDQELNLIPVHSKFAVNAQGQIVPFLF